MDTNTVLVYLNIHIYQQIKDLKQIVPLHSTFWLLILELLPDIPNEIWFMIGNPKTT
jgi:hypothetical protein